MTTTCGTIELRWERINEVLIGISAQHKQLVTKQIQAVPFWFHFTRGAMRRLSEDDQQLMKQFQDVADDGCLVTYGDLWIYLQVLFNLVLSMQPSPYECVFLLTSHRYLMILVFIYLFFTYHMYNGLLRMLLKPLFTRKCSGFQEPS